MYKTNHSPKDSKSPVKNPAVSISSQANPQTRLSPPYLFDTSHFLYGPVPHEHLPLTVDGKDSVRNGIDDALQKLQLLHQVFP